MNEQHQIEKWIVKQLLGDVTPEEQQVLLRWRQQDEKNETLYQKVIKQERIKASFDLYQSIDSDAAFTKVIGTAGKSRRLIPLVLKYAAAIAIPLILGLSIWLMSDTGQENMVLSDSIVPGGQRATVLLSDGSEVELDSNTSSFVLKDKGQVVGQDSLNTLAYNNIETDDLIYNTVKIPYGGEYQLQLSDGTKVWLNSGSVLKFPVSFKGDRREVSLKGEAYFEVAHNASSPFIVHTDHSNVKVYGTAFNVMSYEDEEVEQVTLVEGSVGLEVNGQQTMIQPGQQAELNINTTRVELKEVNTALYTSWVDGIFRFKNMSMKEISRKLARWYNVDFFFANNAVSEFPFTGRIKRDVDFEYFMSLIAKTTNVEITIEGRTVLIKEIK